MKISVEKSDIINLARAYFERNEAEIPEIMFRDAVKNLIKVFRKNGDEELANYLNMMIDENDQCVPM